MSEKQFNLFLYSTGVRVSELVNLNIGDVNFREKSILVKKTKGKKQRYI